MSSNFPPNPQPAYSQQPGYTGPPSNASSSGGAVIMIVVALGVVILLGLACAGAAVGFLFFARVSQDVEQLGMAADRARVEEMQAMQEEALARTQQDLPATTADDAQAIFGPTESARAEWSYPTSPEGEAGVIKQDAIGWQESRNGNSFAHFTEKARTDEFVELFDKERKLSVRLYGDHMEWSRAGEPWFRGQDGAWKPAESVTAAP